MPLRHTLLTPGMITLTSVGWVGLLAVAPLEAQTPPNQLGRAIQILQTQGDIEEAVAILRELTAQNQEHARAWAVLGQALRTKGDLDGAIIAYQRATAFPATMPRALYDLGVTHALKGEPDRAFEWLSRAKGTGKIDMTAIGIDPNAKGLESDSRFATLFPSSSEFADPFVEHVSIIHEWVGEVRGDQFGWIARNIGDVDDDGVNDVTTSAPTNGEAGPAAGKVYVYSGRSGGELWASVGPAGGQLGLGIEAAGDVNGDGIPDVVAGAPGVGKVFVYSGRDGAIVLTLEGEQPGDSFGSNVSDLGDVNGDGYDDVIVGAPGNDAGGRNAGKAYVFSGRDGTVLFSWVGTMAEAGLGSSAAGFVGPDISLIVIGAPGGRTSHGATYVFRGLAAEPTFVIEADSTGAQLGGMFVSVVGDVDADGTPDVYASDWSDGTLGATTGKIYVHSGADGRRLYTLTGENGGDGFGIGPADAGDLNGDGFDDLVIGAWQYAGAAPSGGKVYVFSGLDGTLIQTMTGKVPGETFGFDATGMGDIDGDGTVDFLLTSAWSAIAGTRSGRVFVVSGIARGSPDRN